MQWAHHGVIGNRSRWGAGLACRHFDLSPSCAWADPPVSHFPLCSGCAGLLQTQHVHTGVPAAHTPTLLCAPRSHYHCLTTLLSLYCVLLRSLRCAALPQGGPAQTGAGGGCHSAGRVYSGVGAVANGKRHGLCAALLHLVRGRRTWGRATGAPAKAVACQRRERCNCCMDCFRPCSAPCASRQVAGRPQHPCHTLVQPVASPSLLSFPLQAQAAPQEQRPLQPAVLCRPSSSGAEPHRGGLLDKCAAAAGQAGAAVTWVVASRSSAPLPGPGGAGPAALAFWWVPARKSNLRHIPLAHACALLTCVDAGMVAPLLRGLQFLSCLGAHEVLDGDTLFIRAQVIRRESWVVCCLVR